MATKLLSLLLLLLAGLPPVSYADSDLYIVVLGVGQDGGYPQTNCYRPHCLRAWADPALKRMTSSIAVVDQRDQRKFLFDATPDMREQLYRLHRLAPDPQFVLDGVFLTHGHIGHYVGLMHFGHEAAGSKNVPVYAMPRMRNYLSSNGPWDQLVNYQNIRLMNLEDDERVRLSERLAVTPMLVPHRDEYTETVGFRIDGPNKSALFVPDIDKWESWDIDIGELVRSVDYALLDGSFFADGELPGRDMSKIMHPYVLDSMALFDDLSDEEKSRVIFIHLNHTNPLLTEGSPEQKEVESRGFRVARPGMRLPL